MPEPIGRGQRYMPGLDGLRAIAVLAVVAYHLGLGWAPGGLLGVGVFFTLSGYLITDLLLAQAASGRIAFGDFWLRRARRLLPALFVVLIVVSLWVAISDRSQLWDLRGQVGAAAVYLNNWWEIFKHVSYFARFGPPSPLNHLWSLAVEEQFYLLWPWLLALGVLVVHERRRPIAVRPRLAGVVLVLAVVSAVEMAVLYHPSFDPSRVYDGTDTRAFALLFGAALAMVWPSRLLTRRPAASARVILEVAGAVGLVTIGVLVWRTNEFSPFLYRGGMVLLSLGTVLVVAAASHPATRFGAALGWGPLRWIGVRSYGIYLWSTPVIVLTDPRATSAVAPGRAALQVAGSIALAAVSWRYIEQPIRHGALGRLWTSLRAIGWRPRSLSMTVRAAAALAVVPFVLACLSLAGVRPPGTGSSASARVGADSSAIASTLSRLQAQAGSSSVATPPRARGASTTTAGVPTATNASSAVDPNHTSCRAVVHIGDSTSEGLVSSDYLPNPRLRMAAQYHRVGVRRVHFEITGATSIVETLPGGTDAYVVARRLESGGYRGCWVIALGTNDTADVYVGSNVPLGVRIRRMMSVIGHEPAMWVNVKSLVESGPYSETDMRRWNDVLQRACARYPNIRIFDWAADVRDSWFIPDGIHYNSPGYAARAHLIARALADAFPLGSAPSAGCVVNPEHKP
jgi:peptidoglycan/LPS O-acetylase OafA/YrhL